MHRNEIKAFVKIAAEQAYRKQQLKEFIKQACYMSKFAMPRPRVRLPFEANLSRAVYKMRQGGVFPEELNSFITGAKERVQASAARRAALRRQQRAAAKARVHPSNPTPGLTGRPEPFQPATTAATKTPGFGTRMWNGAKSIFSTARRIPAATAEEFRNLYSAVNNGNGAGWLRRYWGNLSGSTGRRFANNFEGETLGSIAKRFDRNLPSLPTVQRGIDSANHWINKVRPTLTSAHEIASAYDINNLASVAKQLQRARRNAWAGTLGTVGGLGGAGVFYANR